MQFVCWSNNKHLQFASNASKTRSCALLPRRLRSPRIFYFKLREQYSKHLSTPSYRPIDKQGWEVNVNEPNIREVERLKRNYELLIVFHLSVVLHTALHFSLLLFISGRDAVIKYTIFGIKRAKQAMGDREEAKEIFEYIQKVEEMRHCEDPVAAAALAAQYQFSIDHVPGHLLTSQEVSFISYYLYANSYYSKWNYFWI